VKTEFSGGRAFVLAGFIVFLAAGCASDVSREADAFDKKLASTRDALLAAGDADSLAAAADLVGGSQADPAHRMTLLTRAAALEPDRADLVWLQIEACTRFYACDPTPLAETLHSLDAENAAAWAAPLDRATKLNDDDAVRKYLMAMGNSKRFDIYWNTSAAHLTRALIKVHSYDPRTALVIIIGSESALSIPAFRNVLSACKAPALDDADRLKTCRAIAETMRNGDTYITEMVGIAIAKRVWPETSVEYAEAVEARRLGQYRMRKEGEITLTALRRNAGAVAYLQLIGAHRSEQEVALAVIANAGKNPTPPADSKESLPGGS
jgi:hypothetical protein